MIEPVVIVSPKIGGITFWEVFVPDERYPHGRRIVAEGNSVWRWLAVYRANRAARTYVLLRMQNA